MRLIALSSLLLLPLTALAQGDCEHTRTFQLQPDLAGVAVVEFDIGPHRLDLRGSADAPPDLRADVCASDPDLLERLELRQQRTGDRLLVSIEHDSPGWWSGLFGDHRLDVRLWATLPDDLPVELDLGSGDADIRGISELELSVGSGEAVVHGVAGPVRATVGSGDIELRQVGALRIGSVGSGDLQARDVGGDVDVGSIGSGDVELERVAGDIEVGSIGSGDLDAHEVQGGLRVDDLGSGDVDHVGVQGSIDLPEDQ